MKKQTKKVAAEVGAGVLTAAALAVAGAYLLSDKAKRSKARAWAAGVRRDVAKKVGAARRMSGAEYRRLVDQAAKRYGSLHGINATEVRKIAGDMKGEWQQLQKNAKVLAAMAGGRTSRSGKTRSSGKPRRKTGTHRKTRART